MTSRNKMATTILIVFTLFLRTAVLLPISQNEKSVHSNSLRNIEVPVTERTVLYPETIERLGADTEVVKSSVTFDESSVKLVRRIKREAIVIHACPEGTLWFGHKCMTFQEYESLIGDYGDYDN